jgi:hypothetical protein
VSVRDKSKRFPVVFIIGDQIYLIPSDSSDYERFADVFDTLDKVVNTVIEEEDAAGTNLDAVYPVGPGDPSAEVRRDLLLFSDYLFARFKNAGLTPRYIALGAAVVPYMDFYVTVPSEEALEYYIDMSITPNAGQMWYAPGKSTSVHRVDIAINSSDADMVHTHYYFGDDKYVYLDIPARTPIRYTGTLGALSIDDILRLHGYALMILTGASVSLNSPKYLFLRREYTCQGKPGMYVVDSHVRTRYRFTVRDENVFAVITRCSEWAQAYADELKHNAHPIFKLINTVLVMNSNIENKDKINEF